MASRRRQEGGKKQNAEGMHGDRTHKAFQEQLKHGIGEPVDPDAGTKVEGQEGQPGETLKAHVPGPDGKHRLFEDRQQHDEADKNSEKNRLAREYGWTNSGQK